ncbi:MAG TPA: GNAT family N-acetyltransferase [Azospirillaceae bacterium]|nr:GNAT family N-acetyltransferase [Azospirillaceae bacterium]
MADDLPLSFRPLAELPAAEAAAAFNRCFAGYLVSVQTSAEEFERRFRGEDLDPFASGLFLDGDGVPFAVLLVTRRGWTARVAAFALLPASRGRGLGRRAMEAAVAAARARGDRSLVLEVIEGNAPAVRLYEGLGFVRRRRLVGYHRPARPAPAAAPALEEVDPQEVARLVALEGAPGLPWMLAAETLARAVPPQRAYALDGAAYAIIGDPARPAVPVRTLLVRRSRRGEGLARRLLDGLDARHPGHSWGVTAIVPEDLVPGFFAATGWTPMEISQFEMVLAL